MLKIWGRTTSINVQKVMWAVGELKLPHERVDIGGSFGKNNEPAYLAMNPNGLVPTLEGSGSVRRQDPAAGTMTSTRPCSALIGIHLARARMLNVQC